MVPSKKIYFLSDAHLGSAVIKNPKEHELRLVSWLDSIKNSASAIYLLGDMFDFWFEYKHVVPQGFTRFIGKLGELSDAGIDIHFFIGNHDTWTFGYLEKEVGLTLHKKPFIVDLNGKRFFLAHGDGLGNKSKKVSLLKAFFHNRFCQQLFKFLHPSIGIGIGLTWSEKSRKDKGYFLHDFKGENEEELILFAKQYPVSEHIDYFIFGHRHLLLDIQLKDNKRVIILGDWVNFFSYAEFDGENIRLHQLATEDNTLL